MHVAIFDKTIQDALHNSPTGIISNEMSIIFSIVRLNGNFLPIGIDSGDGLKTEKYFSTFQNPDPTKNGTSGGDDMGNKSSMSPTSSANMISGVAVYIILLVLAITSKHFI